MNRRRPTDILIQYMKDCDIDLVVFLASKTYSNTLKPYLYECFLLTLYYDMPELFEKGTEEHMHPDISKNSKCLDKNGKRAQLTLMDILDIGNKERTKTIRDPRSWDPSPSIRLDPDRFD